MVQFIRDLSFRWKLSIPLLLLAVLFIGSVLLAQNLLGQLAGDTQRYDKRFLPGQTLVLEADRDLHQALIAAQRVLSGRLEEEQLEAERTAFQENYQQAVDRTVKAVEALGDERSRELGVAFQRDVAAWKKIGDEVVQLAAEGNTFVANMEYTEKGAPAFDTARAHLDQITLHVNELSEQLSVAVGERVTSSAAALWISLLLGVAVSAAVLILVPRLVLSPLKAVTRRLSELNAGGGDLTLRIQHNSRDEFGRMTGEVDRFLDSLQQMLRQVDKTVQQVAAAAEELSATSRETEQNVDQQRSASEQVSTATNELSATIQEVARNINEAAGEADAADKATRDAQQAMDNTVQRMQALAQGITEGAEAVAHMEADADNVGSVLDVIREVAEQTNLLALNAAIEAARAGDQGRGFAVVADEVRVLASRAHQSTEEIRSIIEKLQQAARGSAEVIHAQVDVAGEVVSQAQNAGGVVNDAAQRLRSINGMNQQIATAAEEQTAAVEEINRNVMDISDAATRSSEGSREVAQSSKELARLGAELQQVVGKFKLA